MIQIVNKSDCCGCTACFSICPKHCITMIADNEGFRYPQVDKNLCVNCGLCEKVCPLQSVRGGCERQKIYGARNNDVEVQKESTSGGGFFAIAKYVIDNGGIVYGAAYNDSFEVIHCLAETLDECRKFHGAKYVESCISPSLFHDIQSNLKIGRLVLFSGTPCQVDGLQQFLRKAYDNLITVDLVCSSVTSPKIFSDYIKFIQRNKKLSSINMRWKGRGWSRSTQKLTFTDGSEVIGKGDAKLWHTIAFSHIANRPSCHLCHYTNFNRPGDFTIGDFWGVENIYPDFFDEKGVSLFMVNSEKGNRIFQQIKDNLILKEVDRNGCIQPRLETPVSANNGRTMFWNQYRSENFEFVARKYWHYGTLNQLKLAVRRQLSAIYHKIKD